MEQAQQIELLRRLRSYAAMRNTASADHVLANDADYYSSPALAAREIDEIFRRVPLIAGLSIDLPENGSYLTADVGGVPVLLVRGQDGAARAFLNVCRHRGAQLVAAPCGTARAFSCPFHAWTYDDQGRLLGVANGASFGDVDRSALGLVELPLAEHHGLLWLSLTPGADPTPELGALGSELENWGLASLAKFEITAFESATNWKLALDTFGETYHFAALHRDTLGRVTHSNLNTYDAYGRNHRIIFAARTIDGLNEDDAANWRLREHVVLTYYIFPNTQIVLAPDGTVSLVRLFPMPGQPGRTRTLHSTYLPKAPVTPLEQTIARHIADATTTLLTEEDYAAAESAQRGIQSGLIDRLHFGRNEVGVQHFHASLRALLGLTPLASVDAERIDADATTPSDRISPEKRRHKREESHEGMEIGQSR